MSCLPATEPPQPDPTRGDPGHAAWLLRLYTGERFPDVPGSALGPWMVAPLYSSALAMEACRKLLPVSLEALVEAAYPGVPLDELYSEAERGLRIGYARWTREAA